MNLTAMLTNHPFWGLLTLAVLVWYSTITVYVGIRGAFDIRHMLRSLKNKHGGSGADELGSHASEEKKS
jgi:hypothetical protein